jgi:hypothetical protein
MPAPFCASHTRPSPASPAARQHSCSTGWNNMRSPPGSISREQRPKDGSQPDPDLRTLSIMKANYGQPVRC